MELLLEASLAKVLVEVLEKNKSEGIVEKIFGEMSERMLEPLEKF